MCPDEGLAESPLTIVAIGTPATSAHVGLVRISGSNAAALLRTLVELPDDRCVVNTRLQLCSFDLPCTLLWMPGPRSYTGEDVAELLLPGNTLLLGLVAEHLIEHGVAAGLPVGQAAPGEFTFRAWRSGQLSMARAESVMQLVHADSDAALAAAHRAGRGAWHNSIAQAAELTASILAIVEAGIDFADEEDVVLASASDVVNRLDGLRKTIGDVLEACGGQAFDDQRPLVRLRGAPSAGKSTLFNVLLGRKRAVTMDTPHTTRDALIEPCAFPGVAAARLADTPGGQERDVIGEEPDLDIWCVPCDEVIPQGIGGLVIRTKSDVVDSLNDGLRVSAKTGEGIEGLRLAIGKALQEAQASSGASLMSARQHGVLERIEHVLVEARELSDAGDPAASVESPELVAAVLREVLDQLGAITGDVSPDDVLGLIFSSFCVGK